MSEARNDGGPAFPVKGGMLFYYPKELEAQLKGVEEGVRASFDGMNLRDYFAIHCDVGGFEFSTAKVAEEFTGLTAPADSSDTKAMFEFSVKIQAALRYRIADAMLAARANGGTQP